MVQSAGVGCVAVAGPNTADAGPGDVAWPPAPIHIDRRGLNRTRWSDECEETGARAAEQIVSGTRTTAAESDTEQATASARRVMTCWGTSERVGLL
jgi:hypothetical protein